VTTGAKRPSHSTITDGRRGARPNLFTLPVDGSRYWQWWLDTYGDEAVVIAKDFMADMPRRRAA